MRVLLLSTALLCVAACSISGPPGANADVTPPAFAERPAAPGGPVPLTPSAEAAPAAATSPAPPPRVAAAPPPPAAAAPPFAWPFALNLPALGQRAPSRLALSNFSYDRAHVEAVVTANPDCGAPDAGVATMQFDLAYNGTRVIEAPVGSDVCWRRDLAAEPGAPPAGPRWSRWNRAYLSAGQSIDSRL